MAAFSPGEPDHGIISFAIFMFKNQQPCWPIERWRQYSGGGMK